MLPSRMLLAPEGLCEELYGEVLPEIRPEHAAHNPVITNAPIESGMASGCTCDASQASTVYLKSIIDRSFDRFC